MNYLIIDDEPIAHRIIEGYCKHLLYLEKAGNCYDAFQALSFLSDYQVDLIFLDINMPKLSGFELLKSMTQQPSVIVTSAYKEYALEGFELNVSDYLLKPFSFDRFLKAINKISRPLMPQNPAIEKSTKNSSLFLKADKKIHQIHFEDIFLIEAQGNYSKVVTKHNTIVVHQKISTFEQELPKDTFLRIHKSFIVSIPRITSLEGNRIRINSHLIPIGQTFKLMVYKALNL